MAGPHMWKREATDGITPKQHKFGQDYYLKSDWIAAEFCLYFFLA